MPKTHPIPSIYTRQSDLLPKPMKNNEIQSFVIDYDRHSNCELVDEDGEKIEEYYVKKTQLKHKNIKFWHFTASINKDFNEEEQRDWILGKSSCKMGFIDLVEVSTSKVRPPSVSDPSSLNARRCGIGTVLSVLCMIDKDVNPGSGIALDLKSHFKLKRPSGFPDTEIIQIKSAGQEIRSF